MNAETQQLTTADIFDTLAKHRDDLRRLGVRRLGLFGSFVRSEQTPDSDVDFLVEFEAGQKTFDNYMDLIFLLEELLGRNVDIGTPESLNPYVKPYVAKEVQYVSLAA
jgi:predicted nucleotidyltransferase